jgi:tripartite-type tricarboxylate transporter receptor subunit TctC
MERGIGRRRLLRGAALLPGLAMPALAQPAAWPRRTLRMIIPFPPGGTTDLMGRLLAERLAQRLGQAVVAENRAGAGGNIGADAVAKAEADGHTILMASVGTAAINYAAYGSRMPYRPADLAAVGLVTRVANVLFASNEVPIGSFAELLEAARKSPGQFNYGSSGIGGSPHACMELVKVRTGLEVQHVPFRGSGPMLTEVVAGRVQLGMDNLPSALPFLRDGRLRPLAVTSRGRTPLLPQVPTLAEAGIENFDATAWFGIQAPAATPAAVVARLGQEIDAIVRQADWQTRLADFAAEPPRLTPEGGTTPDSFAAFIRDEISRWAEVAKAGNITVQ